MTETMEKELHLRNFHESEPYTAIQGDQLNENIYELPTINKKFQQSSVSNAAPDVAMGPKQRQSSWSKPLLLITVLLCLILILLIIILGIVTVVYATGNNVECTNTATGAGSSSNMNEWADRIAQNVYDKLNITDCNQKMPNFTEWANGVVSKVNSNVTGSLADFNEWANGISQNTLQLFHDNTNFTELDKQILQTTRDSAQKLISIVNTLSNLQDTSTSTAGVADDILLIAQELLVLHNDSTALPTSCKEIKERQPLSPSGVYLLAPAAIGGSTYTAYCNMGTLCGSGGGWTRLAYLDMTDATQSCPSGFKLYQSEGVRACGRTNSSGGCVSAQFPSNGISYSQICGRVTGYQYFTTDAFHGPSNLNSYYVDGVSITRGSPRQHVWTLANGLMDTYNNYPHANCPCSIGSLQTVPSFVGNHYFCESGNHDSGYSQILYTSDPLWDGQGCGSLESPCCNVPGIPWFHRDYGSTTTTDYIELRVCGNGGATNNEDSGTSIPYFRLK
ncbi:PREDICTED: uncharacterized protein LOC109585263 [Amphimedon queenslandica]|uniref:Fibrinogen C-terminal domain-containing protein n=1 Tax=Amphimedon queenslandica TaxID=400682 RepID=A0AAN0JIM7_AMPQE|nr:PREDICTED: uncharacterized protein LOC109585263 [Amphimedon queenslandica]|eukprot:XP_019856819.1 PREDICTED: uncharacterized protein LOC109585263 [Amphimedon queenslandica]